MSKLENIPKSTENLQNIKLRRAVRRRSTCTALNVVVCIAQHTLPVGIVLYESSMT